MPFFHEKKIQENFFNFRIRKPVSRRFWWLSVFFITIKKYLFFLNTNTGDSHSLHLKSAIFGEKTGENHEQLSQKLSEKVAWKLLELLTAGIETAVSVFFSYLVSYIEIIVLCYRHVLFFILLKSFLKSKIYQSKNFEICFFGIWV